MRRARRRRKTRVYHIGILSLLKRPSEQVFRDAMHDLGYIEGNNVFYDVRYAEGNADQLPSLAAQLVRLNVDVMVTTGGQRRKPPDRRRRACQLCCGEQAIRSAPVLSPTRRIRVATSQVSRSCPPNSPRSACNSSRKRFQICTASRSSGTLATVP